MISPIFLIIATMLCFGNVIECIAPTCYKESFNKIYLIAPMNNLFSNKMNSKFVNKCSDFYDIRYEWVSDDERMERTLELVANDCNVIDLFFPDNNNLLYNKSKDLNIIYAGGIYMNRAEDSLINIAKIMSLEASHINSGDLLDFVTKIDIDTNSKSDFTINTRSTCLEVSSSEIYLPIVLICSEEELTLSKFNAVLNEQSMNYILRSTKDCFYNTIKFNNHLLAVIAPKPFDSEFSKSTIFYEIPYMSQEFKTWFPNSINLTPGLQLKHAFMKLMDDFGWARIAIISDDSEFSIQFENELIQIFKEKNIIYNAQSCQKTCNFNKIIYNLINLNAKILIANVDEENAKMLYKHIPRYFHVLFRIPPFTIQKKKIRHNIPEENLLFVSLEAMPYRDCIENNNNCKGIAQSLNIIKNVYTTFNNSFKNNHNFYSKFTEQLKKRIKSGAIAVVKRFNGKLLLSMYVNDTGVDMNSVITHNEPFKNIPYDTFEGLCFTKTNDYANYCDMNLLLYFMFVIVIFAITVLVITCYFHKTSPINAINYQQF